LLKIFINSVIISFFLSCSTQQQKFNIDKSISPAIDSIFKANALFDIPITNGFSFRLKRTIDFEKFGQNGMDLAHLAKADSNWPMDVYVNSMTECYLDKDSIILIGVLDDQKAGIGITLSIFTDKFNSRLRLIGNGKIYSKTGKKNDLQEDIILNPDSISLTLTERPTFNIGSELKGKMEVKYESFYLLDSAAMLSKISPRFDILFDTEIMDWKKHETPHTSINKGFLP
jgi:hypothetical protein